MMRKKFSSPHLPCKDYFRKLKGRLNGSNNKEIIEEMTPIPKFG